MPYIKNAAGTSFQWQSDGYVLELGEVDCGSEPPEVQPTPPTPLDQIRALEAQYANDQARMTRVSLLALALEKAQALGYTHEQLMAVDKGYKALYLLEQQVEALRAQI